MQLVIHAPFGSRINRAWGLALRKRFCRSFNLELQAAATDNGIVISLTEQHAFPLELVFEFLKPPTLEHTLTQALLDSPMFAARWRWNVSRALAVLRFAGGKKVPPPIQRMRSDDLMAAVFPDQAACAENLTGEIRIPNHPYVKETIANCLYEAMDLNGLREIVAKIQDGDIHTVAVETAEPSPFSHEILNANPYAFLDDAPLEERRTRAVQMRRSLGFDAADGPGALDPEAIAQVAAEAWPVVRDPDELHDALLTLVVLPPFAGWAEFFHALGCDRRATTMHVDGRAFWVAAERLDLARKTYPKGVLDPEIRAISPARPLPEGSEACVAEVLRGWLDSIGPTTAAALADRLALAAHTVNAGLAQLESEGQILRGQFSQALADPAGNGAGTGERSEKETQWCNRRLLARIHRLTLGRLRREIEPVSSADFMRFLLRWQHAAPSGRLHGLDGTLQVIKQLQGYEISAAAWETHILPRRVAGYKPEFLDRLCLSGEVTWGRLSRHPAFETEAVPPGPANGHENGSPPRRVRPTRVAPMTFFLRDDAGWLLAYADGDSETVNTESLSHPARDVLAALETRGASFFNDLVRTTKRLPSEVEGGLWELVAAGLVTADGFENLRALIDPKRRRGEGRGRSARPRHAAGRWALLREAIGAAREDSMIADESADGPTSDSAAPEAGIAGADDLFSVSSRPDREISPVEAFAHQLLTRWGVVFRDLVRRETLAPPWRDLLVVFRRMEARGEIRGGRFAQAFIGEQFALPEAVELLRSVRRSEAPGEEVVLSSTDPLNLIGAVLPGTRISAATRETVRLRGGVPVAEETSSLVAELAAPLGG
jgi:ATP-dependent Lhr-like helicase